MVNSSILKQDILWYIYIYKMTLKGHLEEFINSILKSKVGVIFAL